MSVDYYMVCPQCRKYAQIFRVTMSGFNPPNTFKVHDFFFEHRAHEEFVTAAHEDDKIVDTAYEEHWQEYDMWGDGKEALPCADE